MTMSSVCPLNNRVCRCDPQAAEEKLRPCDLAKRISKLVRMMSSTYEDGSSAALHLRQLLINERLCNDLAVLIENCNGEIEERKYSDTDAEMIFARGVEKGRAEEVHKRDLPPDFYDADGQPQWHPIALFCQKNQHRLRDDWERTFIDDMAGKTVFREPTEKQAKHLLAIFIRLGGRTQQ
jgi:hypothetical protein